MSVAAGTECRSATPDRVTADTSNAPPTEPAVSTRLVSSDSEPFPYTKVRDWIPLLPQADLSDGAFRLYCISRSVIWENAKGGPPPKPVIEITYEEYATILGRSPRTISRFAQDLYTVGLWEVVERAHRSVAVPGKARPEVRTVMTIRVHDYPHDPPGFTGPVKTWDVLSAIRDSKAASRAARPTQTPVCATTTVSAQSDQGGYDQSDATECDWTDLSPQSSTPGGEDQQRGPSPAETPETAGQCERTSVTTPRTDLSDDVDVSAAHAACDGTPKKNVEEEKPSLPPPSRSRHDTSSAAEQNAGADQQGGTRRESLADELAMFSDDAVGLVGQLYDKTLAAPGLQPLSAADRIGLARRIDSRLAEGWSLARIRAVLTGGSLVGVRMPGRLWAGRLDDMPAFPAVPAPRNAPDNTPGGDRDQRRQPPQRPQRRVVTNDCSSLPEPNPGRIRYEVPDGRGIRLVAKWADARRTLPWCGRCGPDARTLMPRQTGQLPRPCPDCHPDPGAFPPPPQETPSTPDVPAGTTNGTPTADTDNTHNLPRPRIPARERTRP